MKLKKAAMFGFCRMLRKQSGRLFLMSRHSEASKGANGGFKTTRAAMFGLDARIALAIFGALSVISGAALYSAIQQSKVVALVSDLNEASKAIEAFMLDTGQNLPVFSATIINMQRLIENPTSIAGWNGPYFPMPKHATANYSLQHPIYEDLQLHIRSVNDAWGGVKDVDAVLPSTCTGAQEPCGYWITQGGIPTALAEAVDEYIDGAVGYKAGKLRIYEITPGKSYVYFNNVPKL